MKNFIFDNRNGGPNSDRATDSQIKRLKELKIKFNENLTWLQAKSLMKEYYRNKRKKNEQNK